MSASPLDIASIGFSGFQAVQSINRQRREKRSAKRQKKIDEENQKKEQLFRDQIANQLRPQLLQERAGVVPAGLQAEQEKVKSFARLKQSQREEGRLKTTRERFLRTGVDLDAPSAEAALTRVGEEERMDRRALAIALADINRKGIEQRRAAAGPRLLELARFQTEGSVTSQTGTLNQSSNLGGVETGVGNILGTLGTIRKRGAGGGSSEGSEAGVSGQGLPAQGTGLDPSGEIAFQREREGAPPTATGINAVNPFAPQPPAPRTITAPAGTAPPVSDSVISGQSIPGREQGPGVKIRAASNPPTIGPPTEAGPDLVDTTKTGRATGTGAPSQKDLASAQAGEIQAQAPLAEPAFMRISKQLFGKDSALTGAGVPEQRASAPDLPTIQGQNVNRPNLGEFKTGFDPIEAGPRPVSGLPLPQEKSRFLQRGVEGGDRKTRGSDPLSPEFDAREGIRPTSRISGTATAIEGKGGFETVVERLAEKLIPDNTDIFQENPGALDNIIFELEAVDAALAPLLLRKKRG